MKRLSIQLLCLLGIVLLNSECRSQADGDIELVRQYLVDAYPIENALHPVDLTYRDSAITIVETPMLTKVAAIKVYKSTLRTGNPEYDVLSIAIAVMPTKAMTVCVSPTYDETNKGFLELFTGICVVENGSLELGGDLARIFSSITYKGTIRNLKKSDSGVSAELYHHELYWRLVNVEFQNGCIKGVRISNPHAVDEE